NILSTDDYVGDIEGLTYNAKASLIGVRSGTVASQIGLKTGDLVKSIAGRPVKYFRELDNFLISLQGQPISIEVERFESPDSSKSETLTFEIPKSQFS